MVANRFSLADIGQLIGKTRPAPAGQLSSSTGLNGIELN
jgi:hypothetical protein